MKKIILLTVLFLSLTGIGYYAFNHLFPKARAIVYPEEAEIISISIAENSDAFVILDTAECTTFLLKIRKAEPTRTMSVNDYPSVRPYYTLVLTTNSRDYRYFIYEEHSQIYIEIPYEGVYKSNQQLLYIILDSLKWR